VARQRRSAAVSVDATVHTKAKRSNIPTAELEAFAEQGERRPPTMLYPRDPSLDPQLVWKGKDEQDQSDLAVPALPIYIQEKIHPRFLIEDLLAQKRRSEPQQPLDFFSDFNGLAFEQLVDFYQHPMKWQNRMILGDSLLVMASLAEKEGLKGKVQTIYVDPPYGIKFGSNWQVSTRKREVSDGKADDATRQPEQIKAFRDTWELGVNSYLSYLRDRLVVARDLLGETGSIFVQIGDANLHLVRSVLDEVFGASNSCSLITFRKTSSATGELLAGVADYILWYAKDKEHVKYRPLYLDKVVGGGGASAYTYTQLADGTRRLLTAAERANVSLLPVGARVFRRSALTSQSAGREKGEGAASWFPVQFGVGEFRPSMQNRWKTNEQGMRRLAQANRLISYGTTLAYVRFIDDFPAYPITNVWEDTTIGYGETKEYVVQTTPKVVERCVLMTTDPGDLVLDPTCGSGTTAFVAEHWGRRWITIDTSRVALALARTRLMAARFPYYLLMDSPSGSAKEAELAGRLPEEPMTTSKDVGKGFVYQRVRHVTLKSIVTNPEIGDGMTQGEVDAVIARHGEMQPLFDQPYRQDGVVRVTGPFTVESLSPHRVLSSLDAPGEATKFDPDPGSFIERILLNLKKSGVQNTIKNERLIFDRLEPWQGGVYIQAVGEFTENGRTKSVAVCIGPEYGTVGTELVREAAKEAVKVADLLIIGGFAFEAHVGDEASMLGKLTILKAKMNPDLSMADELLKKTGAGNLFMVFGEPDIWLESVDSDHMSVEIRGVDTYNPTTGEIRSDSTDQIACWFLDTDYNSESFFVRHAYFLGGGDPYESLKRVLGADIDEATWSTLYSAKSRPFPKPATGKIAIKVINHYGDEVLKVYPIEGRLVQPNASTA
jgi:adenine-specific DNA-methyltransferase